MAWGPPKQESDELRFSLRSTNRGGRESGTINSQETSDPSHYMGQPLHGTPVTRTKNPDMHLVKESLG